LLPSGEHGSETLELYQEGTKTRFCGQKVCVPGGHIHQHMCVRYGDSARSRRIVYECIEMYKNGCTSVTDGERSGHPTTATTTQNEERAREPILQNRRVTVDEIAKQMNISIGSAYSVVHDNLQFHKVCARWIPKELMNEQKRMCLDICFHHLAYYREEGGIFLQWIITGDEIWV
jgi:hypothetical protein